MFKTYEYYIIKNKIMWKRLPLYAKILISMVIGVIWGFVAVHFGLEKFTFDWIKPWGTIFIKLLKLVAVPLVFVSLVKGVTSITDISKLSRIGFKTIIFYLISTVISIIFGLLIVNTFKPGDTFPEAKRAELQAQYQETIKEKENAAENYKTRSPLTIVEEMVPDNIFNALSDNRKMLQIIFFSILFSVAMIVLEAKKVVAVQNLFDGLNEIILKIVDIIMRFAPFGVFALLGSLITEFSGDADLFIALGKYAIYTILGLFSLIFILYPAFLIIFTKVKPLQFLKTIMPAQMVAFSSSSSAAALPVTLKQCTEGLGVSESVANFVLPVGVTINMNGTSLYQAISAVFIAQVFGLDLTLTQQLTIVLTSTLASIGTPGIPGGGIIMLVIVLTSAGIPAEGIALIFGIERPLDMIRTAVNVTGDSTVAAIIATSEKEILEPQISQATL